MKLCNPVQVLAFSLGKQLNFRVFLDKFKFNCQPRSPGLDTSRVCFREQSSNLSILGDVSCLHCHPWDAGAFLWKHRYGIWERREKEILSEAMERLLVLFSVWIQLLQKLSSFQLCESINSFSVLELTGPISSLISLIWVIRGKKNSNQQHLPTSFNSVS